MSRHEILLVQPVRAFLDRESYWWSEGCGIFLLKMNGCQFRVDERIIESRHQVIYSALEEAARKRDAGLLDLTSRFCSDGYCSNSSIGQLDYQDRTHISAEASRGLAPFFIESINDLETAKSTSAKGTQ